jgi:hypothetical protein
LCPDDDWLDVAKEQAIETLDSIHLERDPVRCWETISAQIRSGDRVHHTAAEIVLRTIFHQYLTGEWPAT